MKRSIYTFFIVAVFLSGAAFAKIGVGVNVGKIQVDEDLRAGMIYDLPSITVINTGDEPSDYKVSMSHQQSQEQLIPSKEWFIFEPSEFSMEPESTQVVHVKIKLPLNTKPGDYFAYLEARPYVTVKQAGASVGVAAASKLYFTVVPANILLGVYYRLASLWTQYLPWSKILAIILGLGVAILVLRKFVHLEIKAQPSKKTSKKTKSDNSEKSF